MVVILCLLLAPVQQQLGAPWKSIADGVQAAPASELGGDAGWQGRVVLLDPPRVQILVRFDAARPTLAQWRQRFPEALAVLNGSFYSVVNAEVKPTCELISEGKQQKGAG